MSKTTIVIAASLVGAIIILMVIVTQRKKAAAAATIVDTSKSNAAAGNAAASQIKVPTTNNLAQQLLDNIKPTRGVVTPKTGTGANYMTTEQAIAAGYTVLPTRGM